MPYNKLLLILLPKGRKGPLSNNDGVDAEVLAKFIDAVTLGISTMLIIRTI